jgi:hypothetical protein
VERERRAREAQSCGLDENEVMGVWGQACLRRRFMERAAAAAAAATTTATTVSTVSTAVSMSAIAAEME